MARLGHFLLFVLCVTNLVNADTLSVSITESQPHAFTWSYAVTNNEPSSSTNFLIGFELAIHAQLSSVQAPNGWNYQTDGYNYVYWFSDSTSVPYSDDVAPGALLTGFMLSADALSGSAESVVYSWDHLADEPGPISYGTIDAPIAAAAPEPAGEMLLIFGICFIFWQTRCKRSC